MRLLPLESFIITLLLGAAYFYAGYPVASVVRWLIIGSVICVGMVIYNRHKRRCFNHAKNET